jgi:hypothetical protein
MTRTPFDSFSKQILEVFLSPIGQVETSYEVPGESRFVDVYFSPSPYPQIEPSSLGLLGRIATTPCLIEPFRQPPSLVELRHCLLKLFSVHADLHRQAKRDDSRILEAELPVLWVLSPSLSQKFLQGFEATAAPGESPGVYRFGPSLKTMLIAINQLPQQQETLWLRLLGKGRTQQRAISEVLALSADDPWRLDVLQLLVSWKISIELTNPIEQEEENLMVTLSQAYLEWEQQTEQRGELRGLQREKLLILRQLTRRVGKLPKKQRTRVENLSVTQLEDLGEALLDFESMADLLAWLEQAEQEQEG